MPIIRDPMSVPARTGTIYPEPFKNGFDGRQKRSLSDLLGLTHYIVNLTTLEPGARSAHRHWHDNQDEFIFIVSGELTLQMDGGEQVLLPSMMAGFPAGDTNGHCLINKSSAPATYLELGTRVADEVLTYPDIDLKAEKRDGKYRFLHKNGEPYA